MNKNNDKHQSVMRRFLIQLENFFGWNQAVRENAQALLEEAKRTNQKLKEINDTLKNIAEREPDPLAALIDPPRKGEGNDAN